MYPELFQVFRFNFIQNIDIAFEIANVHLTHVSSTRYVIFRPITLQNTSIFFNIVCSAYNRHISSNLLLTLDLLYRLSSGMVLAPY